MKDVLSFYSKLCISMKVFPYLTAEQKAGIKHLSTSSFMANDISFIDSICNNVMLFNYFQPLAYLTFTQCSVHENNTAFAINSLYGFTYILDKFSDKIFVVDSDFEFAFYVAKTQSHFKKLVQDFLKYEIEFLQKSPDKKNELTKKYLPIFINSAGGEEYKDYLLLLFPSFP